MSTNLDKSLDQVIKQNKTRRTARRNSAKTSAKAALLGSSGTVAKAAKATKKTKPVQTKAAPNAPPKAEKIIVSNLPQDVNEEQIKELFHNQIGPTKEVTLSYDAHGRSKGIASVVFLKAGHGTKAFEAYNGRLIDGKQSMKIEIVVDPTKPLPLSQRVSAAAAAAPATVKATKASPKRAKKGRPLRRKGAGLKRPVKSAEDLDAEMMDYAAGANNTGIV